MIHAADFGTIVKKGNMIFFSYLTCHRLVNLGMNIRFNRSNFELYDIFNANEYAIRHDTFFCTHSDYFCSARTELIWLPTNIPRDSLSSSINDENIWRSVFSQFAYEVTAPQHCQLCSKEVAIHYQSRLIQAIIQLNFRSRHLRKLSKYSVLPCIF